MTDTIFALSSGAPPAGIAVLRISGPEAGAALRTLSGSLPAPRRASYRILHDGQGDVLDRALVLWFPGPATATGEDLSELHLHGGRAVIAAVEAALLKLPGLRRAVAGEFTHRAFANGRIDLAEAEGLADLLSAETEIQRRTALVMAGGELSRTIEAWRERVLSLSAMVESVLDFGDEDDVVGLPTDFDQHLADLGRELTEWLARPRSERLREGYRVVLAGPPNAGKSSLFNALVEDEAAITAPLAGTTRDVLTRPVALGGIPFLFIDTAGLRDDATDAIEVIGVERARSELDKADLVLWLGPDGEGPDSAWEIEPQIDRAVRSAKSAPRHRVSAKTGDGLDGLRSDLVGAAGAAMPRPGDAALNARQHAHLAIAANALRDSRSHSDPLLTAENLRVVRSAFDAMVGRTTTEDMLDALFGRFCIGK